VAHEGDGGGIRRRARLEGNGGRRRLCRRLLLSSFFSFLLLLAGILLGRRCILGIDGIGNVGLTGGLGCGRAVGQQWQRRAAGQGWGIR